MTLPELQNKPLQPWTAICPFLFPTGVRNAFLARIAMPRLGVWARPAAPEVQKNLSIVQDFLIGTSSVTFAGLDPSQFSHMAAEHPVAAVCVIDRQANRQALFTWAGDRNATGQYPLAS